ncbi:MAG: hypothetical protein HY834_01545 [Devosia nanyangense]|uniref:Uncharacterized protein n=1 Tax=Devosia nanyangense TaxID=1228055 RepID=A0A933NXH0_9HYPH|nr:hypothetical protein [Devosia nanyangense]
MKKTLIIAALLSVASALPATPSMAGDLMATKTGVEAKCFVLPGLPDCIVQWRAEAAAHGWSWTPLPNAWWTCKPAAKDAGHLFDCAAE